MEKNIVLDGQKITYDLIRKKVKNINLRIRPDSTVEVSAADRVPVYRIEEMMRKNKDFILKALSRCENCGAARAQRLTYDNGESVPLWGVPHSVSVVCGKENVYTVNKQLMIAAQKPFDEQSRKAAADAFFKKQLSRRTDEYLESVCPSLAPYGIPVPKVSFRYMSSRWGSCRPASGRITLSLWLCFLPWEFAEYVIMHELVHFLHPDHSAAFYSRLGSFMPDWKQRKALCSNWR